MKKPISLVLAVIMALSCLTVGTTAFAVDGAKTAKVTLTGSNKTGAFVINPFEAEVSADLSDKYASDIGYNDSSDEPTMLDAAIALHIEVYGEDFPSCAAFTVDTSEGWAKITSIFGKPTSTVGYWNNNVMSMGLTDTVKDGDYAYFGIYQDGTGWSDQYVYADALEKTAYIGTTDITFMIAGWGESAPAAGFTVYEDGIPYGTTDSDGKISINVNFLDEKEYTLESTAAGKYVFPAYCKIKGTSSVYDYVKKEEAAAAQYVFAGAEGFTLDQTFDFLTLIRSGYDVSGFAAGYAQDIKANLDANGGKIKVKKKIDGTETPCEDLAAYGGVILVLGALGYDTASFNGYDINAAFEAAAIDDTTRPNPYHYKYAIEAATPTRAKAFIKDFIDTGYVLGSGLDYWGYNCDNTCHFLISIAPYAADYADYVTDAKNVINSYLIEGGYYCDSMWAPYANANSTSLAMAAFASVGDTENAFNTYKLLVDNFESDKAGIFNYIDEADACATKDSLFSLYYFKELVMSEKYDTKEHIFKLASSTPSTCSAKGSKVYNCVLCGIERVEDIEMLAHTPTVDAAVAPTFKKAGKTKGTHCSVCGKVLKAQKTVAKLGAPAISKLTKGNGKIIVKWKAVKGVDGYQIQYSVKKNMKGKKTVTVKNAKAAKRTIKKLKNNKKYYVRIRAYKTINGKKQYSKWSAKKSVKTK